MHKEIIIEAIATVVEDAGYPYTVFGDSIIVKAGDKKIAIGFGSNMDICVDDYVDDDDYQCYEGYFDIIKELESLANKGLVPISEQDYEEYCINFGNQRDYAYAYISPEYDMYDDVSMLGTEYAIDTFDGYAWDIHEHVLDFFWSYEIEEFASEINRLSNGLVEVYTYKGKEWYIVPAIDSDFTEYSVQIRDAETGEYEEYVSDPYYFYCDPDREDVKKAASDVVEYLTNYKHDMEIRSGVYFVEKLIKEQKSQLEIDSETIENFIYNEGFEFADKLEWDKVAQFLIKKHEKENQDD